MVYLLLAVLIILNIFTLSKIKKMSAQLEDLQAKVAAEDTVIDSAEALLIGIKTALDEALANDDSAALQALSDSIGAKTAELAAAVAANTPATTTSTTTV